jgi:hypothetical protein
MKPDDRKRFIHRWHDDEWLDAALKQCGAAEPRPGLEDRVLAGIRIEHQRATAQTRKWLQAPAFAAAMLLIGTAFLMRKPDAVMPASVADHPTTQALPQPAAKASKSNRPNRTAGLGQAPRAVAQSSLSRSEQSVTMPRLEQFPSPLPLSEQEELLANYVQQFPQQAALIAHAQTELLQQELIERQQASSNDRTIQDSEEQNP